MDNYPISSKSLEKHYHINGDHFGQQYKDHLSDYQQWDQKDHAEDWLLFPDNLGTRLSLDETSLSNGELYTILTNKAARGKKGVLVAMIRGTKAEAVIEVLTQISKRSRDKVEEITLDMAGSMNLVAKHCFGRATKVIDRFHVQKLAYDALQEMRIKHRWDAINEETNAIDNARWEKQNMCLFALKTAIPKSNCWPEVVTCYSNQPKNGRPIKRQEPKSCLPNIPTSTKLLA